MFPGEKPCLKVIFEDFPVGAVDGRGHRFDPWSGRIPHASEQLSLCATVTEPGVQELLKPTCLESVLCNKRSHQNEKPTHGNEE